MKKILKNFIMFLVLSIGSMGGVYIGFNYIYKPGVYNEWYEYFCYIVCIVGAAYYTKEINKS